MSVRFDVERLSRKDAFEGLGPGGFWVELYGVSQPMHDYHSPEPFRSLVLGLRRARGARVAFTIVFRLTRSNYRHAPEMVRVAHALGARALGLLLADPGCRVPRPLPELAAPFVARAFDTARALGLPIADERRAEPAWARTLLPGLG